MDPKRAEQWLTWLAPFVGQPAVHGLEVGAWKGETAAWCLEHVFNHPTATYTTVDSFLGGADHHAYGIDCSTIEADCRAALARFPNAYIYKGESAVVLRRFQTPRFSFAYIDASHTAFDTLRDAVLAFDILVPGGVMVFDDYTWAALPDPLDRPKMAIDAFLHCYSRQCRVLHIGYQAAIQKVSV